MTAPSIRILLVDDHPIMREGLALLLNNQPDMSVTEQAGTAEEALQKVAAGPIDLVLLDLNLGKSMGLDLLPIVRQRHPEVIVLVLSMHGDPDLVRGAMRLGASGFVRKQDAGELLLQGIRKVVAGEIFLPRELAETAFRSGEPSASLATAEDPKLTPREREILRLLGDGRTPAEIGQALGISPRTVDAHQTNLKRKLHVASTRELLLLARRFSHPGSP